LISTAPLFARAPFRRTIREIIMARGVVKWFDLDAGYGVIGSEQGVDVLVRTDQLAGGLLMLQKGQAVQFDMVFPTQGPEATVVRRITAEAPRSGRAMNTGTVRWFDKTKRFGLLRTNEGREVFVRGRVIQTPDKTLEQGDEVEFDWIYATLRIEAANVTSVSKYSSLKTVTAPSSYPDVDADNLLKVFMCHAGADKPRVRQFVQQLRALPVKPWLDEEDILPGRNWEIEISAAIEAAHVVIVCLSAQAVTKTGFVHKEITQALDVADEQPENSIYVIPVRFEICTVPERLRKFHWVDYWEAPAFSRLTAALRERAVELGLPWR
jgi:cold shock CspA family protein